MAIADWSDVFSRDVTMQYKIVFEETAKVLENMKGSVCAEVWLPSHPDFIVVDKAARLFKLCHKSNFMWRNLNSRAIITTLCQNVSGLVSRLINGKTDVSPAVLLRRPAAADLVPGWPKAAGSLAPGWKFGAKIQENKKTAIRLSDNRLILLWRARRDSNPRPTDSKSGTLSS